jgi:hypothetical protein
MSIFLTSARQTDKLHVLVSDAQASLKLSAICPFWGETWFVQSAFSIIRPLETLSRELRQSNFGCSLELVLVFCQPVDYTPIIPVVKRQSAVVCSQMLSGSRSLG